MPEVKSNVMTIAPVLPEYNRLFYIDMEFQDAREALWFETKALVDCGSQGSCINEKESQTYLTSHILKPAPTKMIMADGNISSAGPITHYDPI